MRGRYAYARHVHSASGLTRRLTDPSISASATRAVPFIEDALNENPGKVTILALGPLTNLARLWRKNPEALRSAERIIVMGGAVNCSGNATAHAEFNFYSDPTAARMIFDSGIPLTLIDLGACRRVSISRSQTAAIRSANRLGALAAELLDGWFARDATRERFYLYDPLAVLAATHPHVIELSPFTIQVIDSGRTDDFQMWGKCDVVDSTHGSTLVAAPDRVDSDAAWTAICELLDWKQEEGPHG